MKRMLAASAILALALSACGGGGRPSTDEIADAIKDNDEFSTALGTAGDDAVDCVAEALHDSDLSDDALQAIVDGDEGYDPSKEDEEALSSIFTKDLMECLAP